MSHAEVFAEQVAHRHVPGRAYEVADATAKLIHTIGGGFFNEPKYYDTNRSLAAFYAELLLTGRIASTITDESGLTEQAREVLETALAVARSDRPEDLLVIAAWARDPRQGLRLRSTPAVLLALAAALPGTKPFVARYATKILRRADEIRLCFGMFRHLFQPGEGTRHKGGLPHGLRKGLAKALSACSDYELLKYDDGDRPRFADVLKMVGGSRKLPARRATGWPVSRALFAYLVNGEVVEGAPDILLARQRFFATKDAAEVSEELVREAGRWADRLSVNVELPSQDDLDQLAPEKSLVTIRRAMTSIRERIDETRDETRMIARTARNAGTPLVRSAAAPTVFAPAGQSTQLIVGATAASDASILETSRELYDAHKLRRVYYSAFSPIPDSPGILPSESPPLVREHRLYQADWLVRFYGFAASELTTAAEPNLDLQLDPKLTWALRNRGLFPVDVNRAARQLLLRIPGVGARSVDRMLAARRWHRLRLADLLRLKVAMTRALPFILAADHNPAARTLDVADLRMRLLGRRTQLDLFSAPLSAVSGEL